MILLCAALPGEWQPLREQLGLYQAISPHLSTDKNHNLFLLRTGLGSTAAVKLKECLSQHQFERVINAGTAGSLTVTNPPGMIFRIGRVVTTGDNESFILSEWAAGEILPRRDIVTVDKPVVDRQVSETLAEKFGVGLIDMELWHLARVCHGYDLPLSAIKIVSDLADENTGRDFKLNYRVLSGNLAGWFANNLNRSKAG